jgi:hypothetical protein
MLLLDYFRFYFKLFNVILNSKYDWVVPLKNVTLSFFWTHQTIRKCRKQLKEMISLKQFTKYINWVV